MTRISITHKKILFFLVIFYNIIVNINGQENQLKPRVSPGCTLLQSKIYCYGGFTEFRLGEIGPYFLSPLNEHIVLDLQTVGNLSQFNQSSIQWKPVSNTYNGNNLTSVGDPATVKLNDDSYIMYGGAATTDVNNPNIAYPFLHYNPQNDIWNALPLMPSNTYSTQTEIVNLGNDSIWIWGGTLNSTNTEYIPEFGVFNYQTAAWSNIGASNRVIRLEHTTTLASNGLIYIIGGYDNTRNAESMYIFDFNLIFTYDTKSLTWGNINATGQIPTDRGLHTTTATADGKSFLLYGGAKVLSNGLSVAQEVYFIFDIGSNSFTRVQLPANELSPYDNNTRFGHFAALYNSTYLVLSFGYRDSSVPAESLSILNVADPTKPVWAMALSETDTSKDNGGGENGPDSKTLIPAIIVPVVVVLLGSAVGLFFFIRHRKQQRQNEFRLEEEDPRKRDSTPLDFTDTTTETATTEMATTAINSDPLNRRSVEMNKLFMMEYDNQTAGFDGNYNHVINTDYQHDLATKTELYDTNPVKPFDAGH
ncbi:unnamed protein product [Cunninghamella echinulata]